VPKFEVRKVYLIPLVVSPSATHKRALSKYERNKLAKSFRNYLSGADSFVVRPIPGMRIWPKKA